MTTWHSGLNDEPGSGTVSSAAAALTSGGLAESVSQLSYLDVNGPNGEAFRVDLPEATSVSIGRSADCGIVLTGDPYVSRLHCRVECRDGGLLVTDNGSLNGTLVHRDGEWHWVHHESASLGNSDVIRISGRPSRAADGTISPGFWDLTFHDPFATNPMDLIPWVLRLELDWARGKLFRVSGATRQELPISQGSQEYKMLRFMDERNTTNHQIATECTHEELIAAIWEGDQAHGHTPNDVAHLVRDLRRKLEPKPDAPRLLVTVRGGYRLETHPLPEYGTPSGTT